MFTTLPAPNELIIEQAINYRAGSNLALKTSAKLLPTGNSDEVALTSQTSVKFLGKQDPGATGTEVENKQLSL